MKNAVNQGVFRYERKRRDEAEQERGNEPVVDESPSDSCPDPHVGVSEGVVLRHDPPDTEIVGLVRKRGDELPEQGMGEDLLLRKD